MGFPIRHKKAKPAELRVYHEWVAAQGCLISGQDATVHHVTGYADRMGRFTRDDWLVVPLAPQYHLIQHGPHQSVEAVGHRGFYVMHGVDLLEEAKALRDRWKDMQDG